MAHELYNDKFASKADRETFITLAAEVLCSLEHQRLNNRKRNPSTSTSVQGKLGKKQISVIKPIYEKIKLVEPRYGESEEFSSMIRYLIVDLAEFVGLNVKMEDADKLQEFVVEYNNYVGKTLLQNIDCDWLDHSDEIEYALQIQNEHIQNAFNTIDTLEQSLLNSKHRDSYQNVYFKTKNEKLEYGKSFKKLVEEKQEAEDKFGNQHNIFLAFMVKLKQAQKAIRRGEFVPKKRKNNDEKK